MSNLAMNNAPLFLENIYRGYGKGETRVNVLNGASLSIGAGEMVALVAPSGTGKSTLLHIAGLLEKPEKGDVFIAGRNTREMGDDALTSLRRTHIGFVYQFHHLLPEFTAVENVMFPQMLTGLAKPEAFKRASELLGYLGLEKRLTHRPAELSGGEQQRVAIARAMANAPHVMLADEPTGNLDPGTADHVFNALSQLVRASGVAALIATHNHELADRMNRKITLRDGKVVEITGGL
jgi:lipoprotein-releasing system ATP-binding protein